MSCVLFVAQVHPKELEARTRNVNMLRQNLNLLNETFRDQTQRTRNVKEDPQRQRVEINVTDSAIDRDLTEAEKEALNQFQENDRELEAIALEIANSLGDLRNKADKIGEAVQG